MASVLPYQFEPESDPESDNGADGANDERDVSRRLDQDVSLWCTCGNCATMPSEVENVCCREITKAFEASCLSQLCKLVLGLLRT
ncbi:uncharacterized protein LOC121710111 isoform X2 [Alosa sapidissima]|uniref:uncharacterized protein LOC121680664 isoform X2 n=1 Tax=Alosa sapidissima TaxID=34773 RepID=UPI001C09C209|nr:uncharacterized protein LOC121680664 isoform X2 [Alosa sapidissima]XP_041926889.1 uncharacterized protein LOC121690416 isoform X2 [Alosa sapidissima]XP_041929955.1 uncharacterized protein LOC121694082 isoform X2 [Alosa sapidissima]XP_041939120.1 uncharacterized protein LOC121700291 isoform X2 [Alosa sapidissima]XP_041943583.1 uncharacterized protein LOC121706150 isoform X2 [Alosa sapidissima]XP_041948394.1 uncharacterized protein LOC121709235 isoform X2 [Alosa sapidissima]XP_041949994.1 un